MLKFNAFLLASVTAFSFGAQAAYHGTTTCRIKGESKELKIENDTADESASLILTLGKEKLKFTTSANAAGIRPQVDAELMLPIITEPDQVGAKLTLSSDYEPLRLINEERGLSLTLKAIDGANEVNDFEKGSCSFTERIVNTYRYAITVAGADSPLNQSNIEITCEQSGGNENLAGAECDR